MNPRILAADKLSHAVQDAWDEYHRTPESPDRVEPYFVATLLEGNAAKLNYAKFLRTFNEERAKSVLAEIADAYSPAMFYLGQIYFSQGEPVKSLSRYREASKNGHLVAAFFHPFRLFAVLANHRKVRFLPYLTLKILKAFFCIVSNAKLSTSQL